MSYYCPSCKENRDTQEAVCPDCGSRLIKLRKNSLVGVELDNKFVVKSLLGQGGMGAVYLAHQTNMDRDVAIKVLAPEFASDENVVARFYQEVRAVSKLRHANCITVYDFGQTDDDLLYIVMEYLEGRPLSRLVKDEAPVPLERAAHIVGQICDALGEAHQKDIIHRDLKSDNIFVTNQYGNPDFVKVLDFGIAKLPASEGMTAVTKVGIIIGTPSYMSPEQAQSLEIDARSDLYSLGVILYELLSGTRPFQGETPVALIMSHVKDEAPSIREAVPHLDLPVEVEQFLFRTLAKSPDQRPSNAAEFKRELFCCLENPGSNVWAASAVGRMPVDSEEEIRTQLLDTSGERSLDEVRGPGRIDDNAPLPAATMTLLHDEVSVKQAIRKQAEKFEDPTTNRKPPVTVKPAPRTAAPRATLMSSQGSQKTLLAGIVGAVVLALIVIVAIVLAGSPDEDVRLARAGELKPGVVAAGRDAGHSDDVKENGRTRSKRRRDAGSRVEDVAAKPPTDPDPDPEPEKTVVEINTVPKGAAVWAASDEAIRIKQLCRTPCEHSYRPRNPNELLIVRLDGFKDAILVVDWARSVVRQDLKLERDPTFTRKPPKKPNNGKPRKPNRKLLIIPEDEPKKPKGLLSLD